MKYKLAIFLVYNSCTKINKIVLKSAIFSYIVIFSLLLWQFTWNINLLLCYINTGALISIFFVIYSIEQLFQQNMKIVLLKWFRKRGSNFIVWDFYFQLSHLSIIFNCVRVNICIFLDLWADIVFLTLWSFLAHFGPKEN